MFLVYLELKLLPSENFPLSMYRLAVVLVAPIQLLHYITYHILYRIPSIIQSKYLQFNKKKQITNGFIFLLPFFTSLLFYDGLWWRMLMCLTFCKWYFRWKEIRNSEWNRRVEPKLSLFRFFPVNFNLCGSCSHIVRLLGFEEVELIHFIYPGTLFQATPLILCKLWNSIIFLQSFLNCRSNMFICFHLAIFVWV